MLSEVKKDLQTKNPSQFAQYYDIEITHTFLENPGFLRGVEWYENKLIEALRKIQIDGKVESKTDTIHRIKVLLGVF